MDRKLKTTISELERQYNGNPSEFRGEFTIMIGKENIIEASKFLKDNAGFEMLLDITAVDYHPQLEPRFHLVYHFYSMSLKQILVFRVPLAGDHPVVSTLENVYPNANWYEREIWDLMGIRFEGNHDHRRILLPQDWEGHPLRKDFPLGYEEVQFTFNIDDVNKLKRYPKE